MCGIAGIYRFDRQNVPPQDVAALEAMAAIQHHRGPDAGGQATLGCCALASQRLSILDLSPLGHMPMRSDDGRLALITNGEIYNYVEIRDELRRLGHVFRSDGDTEVILRAYQEWGAACVERFVGMWAFALFDTVEHTLLLSRDRLGVKPLYVHRTPERLVFASEIKAIVTYLRQVGEPVRTNPTSIATYVATGLVDGLEHTFFDGVTRFPAAATMHVRPQGVQTKTYWDLPSRAAALGASVNHNGVSKAPWRAVRQALDEAVRVHLRSDVPLGVCLSGGLDSSAIVGLASQYVERVKTFTVYFGDGPEYDERQHAHPIVQQFGADASERCIEPTDVLGTLKHIVWHLDEPSLALGVYPQWHVMSLARDSGVKVVLDGQGGDEVFAGLRELCAPAAVRLARLAANALSIRDGGARALSRVFPSRARRPAPRWRCGSAAPCHRRSNRRPTPRCLRPTCAGWPTSRTTSGGCGRASSTAGSTTSCTGSSRARVCRRCCATRTG